MSKVKDFEVEPVAEDELIQTTEDALAYYDVLRASFDAEILLHNRNLIDIIDCVGRITTDDDTLKKTIGIAINKAIKGFKYESK